MVSLPLFRLLLLLLAIVMVDKIPVLLLMLTCCGELELCFNAAIFDLFFFFQIACLIHHTFNSFFDAKTIASVMFICEFVNSKCAA